MQLIMVLSKHTDTRVQERILFLEMIKESLELLGIVALTYTWVTNLQEEMILNQFYTITYFSWIKIQLLYVSIYLYQGILPWQNTTRKFESRSDLSDFIMEMKKSIDHKDLIGDLPDEFADVLDYTKISLIIFL